MKLLSTLTSEDPEYKEFAVSYGRLLSLLSRSGGGATEPHARRGRARADFLKSHQELLKEHRGRDVGTRA